MLLPILPLVASLSNVVVTSLRFAPLVRVDVVRQPGGGGYVLQTTEAVACALDDPGLAPGERIAGYR